MPSLSVRGAWLAGAAAAALGIGSQGGNGSVHARAAVARPDTLRVDTVFATGFESGSLAEWDDRGAPQNQTVVTDPPGAHSGNAMLQVTYPRGSDGGWLTKFFMPGYDSIYISYWVRFQAGWRGGTKLLQVLGSRIDDRWSGTGKAGKCPNGADFFYLGIVQERSGSPGPTHFYAYFPGMPREADRVTCYGSSGEGRGAHYVPPLEIPPPSWHHVEYWIRLNTPGHGDLDQKFCIDGVARAEWLEMSVRSDSALRINSVTLTNSIAGGALQTQLMWVDDFLVTRQRPPGAC